MCWCTTRSDQLHEVYNNLWRKERNICLLLREHMGLRPATPVLGVVPVPLDYVHLPMVGVQVLQPWRSRTWYSTGTPHQWSGCPKPWQAECWAGQVSLKKTAGHSQAGGQHWSGQTFIGGQHLSTPWVLRLKVVIVWVLRWATHLTLALTVPMNCPGMMGLERLQSCPHRNRIASRCSSWYQYVSHQSLTS